MRGLGAKISTECDFRNIEDLDPRFRLEFPLLKQGQTIENTSDSNGIRFGSGAIRARMTRVSGLAGRKTQWTIAEKPLKSRPVMKNNLLTVALTWVLAISLIASVFFCIQFYFQTKRLRTDSARLQQEMARFQNNRSLIGYLINDVAEYGKTHPGIDPILESVGLKMNRTNSAAAKPAAK